jgi:hypothetical protein
MIDLTTIDTNTARLPSSYHAAKGALRSCISIDECKDWADKASALASYAKQAGDTQLEDMAKRIRARGLGVLAIMLGLVAFWTISLPIGLVLDWQRSSENRSHGQ